MLGCASTPKPSSEVYVDVAKPVPVSCVPKSVRVAPTTFLTPAQLRSIPDGPARYVAMAEDWLNRVARMNDTEAVIASCKAAGPAP